MKEQFQLESLLVNKKIPSRPEFAIACKFADWFFSIFQSLQMHFRVLCNYCYLADSSSFKTTTGVDTAHVALFSGPDISEKTKETKVI